MSFWKLYFLDKIIKPDGINLDILHYIGVDFHPYQQTIAFVDNHGEIKTRCFYHADKVSRKKFYQQFPKGSVVGVEASGSFQWFEKMLFELQFELSIGNPWLIRKMARKLLERCYIMLRDNINYEEFRRRGTRWSAREARKAVRNIRTVFGV